MKAGDEFAEWWATYCDKQKGIAYDAFAYKSARDAYEAAATRFRTHYCCEYLDGECSEVRRCLMDVHAS